MPTTHDLRNLTMREAYDATQMRDDIKHGDVLIVTDGVAILDRAWPLMYRGTSKVFHMLADGANWHDVLLDQRTAEKRDAFEAGLELAALVSA